MKKLLFRLFIVSLILSTTILSVSSQDAVSVSIENLIDEGYPTLTFEVTPNNEFGVPLTDLTIDDFTISDDVGPLTRTAFIPQADPEKPNVDPDQPITIMLALDVSGSIVRAGALDQIKQAAVQLREELGPNDALGVLFFNEAADGTRVVEFDPDPELGIDPRETAPSLDGGATINFINEFNTTDEQAGTPLYDAIYRSVQVLNQETQDMEVDTGRRAVIVMTDGVDEGRLAGEPGSIGADLDLVIREANNLKIPVFPIGVGENVDRVELRNIAAGTGARATIDASVDDLSALFVDVADQLKTKYSISADARVQPDDATHTLNVQIETELITAEGSTSFQALFPFEPIIDLSYITNDGVTRQSSLLANGVNGTIVLRPEFSSRNEISRVDFIVNDVLAESVDSRPFEYAWDTTSLPNDENATLRIEVFDTADPPFTTAETFSVQVDPCNARCLAAESNPTDLSTNNFIYVLIAAAILVLLLVGFIIYWLTRGNNNQTSNDISQDQIYQPGPLTGDQLGPQIGGGFPSPIDPPPVAGGGPVSGPNPTVVQDNPQPNLQPNLPIGSGGVEPTIDPGGSPQNVPGFPVQAPPPFQQNTGAVGVGGGYQPPAKTEVLTREPEFHAYLFNPGNGQQYRISDTRTTIGRKPENNIHLSDHSVSGNHAAIKIEDKKFIIYDLGAANPVEVNGTTVKDPVELSDGDQLTFGRLSFVFKVLDPNI